jgi:hypothetical protein
MYQTTSAIIPRGDLRQRRGDRLLVTRAHPFLQLPVLADALEPTRLVSAQLAPVRAQRAAIFYCFPLGPDFDLSLCWALLCSTSSLCLYYFLLYEDLRFRARARRSMKDERRSSLRPPMLIVTDEVLCAILTHPGCP